MMRNSVVALNVAISVVFDEATDTDSEDDAELRPSVPEWRVDENNIKKMNIGFEIEILAEPVLGGYEGGKSRSTGAADVPLLEVLRRDHLGQHSRDAANFIWLVLGCIEAKVCK